jgi:osmoprotectant transport system ATP-binding protein
MIEFEQVTKVYPDGTEAVKEVSFKVQRGEFCILLGPSGCGKTTLMKMVNRLISITSGKILIDGVDNTKLNEVELRRGMGYAIQSIGLFPHITVAENVATVPNLLGWPKAKSRQRAAELVELVGMAPGEVMDKYPRELSGGQCQRIGVARCLGAGPPLLLMDEPFGAIDPITRARLQDEFLKIQSEIKKTIVFVTHDINEAIKMGDKIALLKDGELIQYDTPARLLSKPKNDFVTAFVGADRALKGLRLMKVGEVMRTSPPMVKVDEDIAVVKKRMEEEGIEWLMVVGDDRKFLGWVGKSYLEKGDRLKDIIVPPATTADRNTPLSDALSYMLGSAVGTLAIVDDRGSLEGELVFDGLREALKRITTEEAEV